MNAREEGARHADSVIANYTANASLEECLSDLLGDARHLCDKYGLDYAERDQVGYRNYQSDLAEDRAAEAKAGGATFK